MQKSLITAIDIVASSKAFLLYVQDTSLPNADDNQEFLGLSLFKARFSIPPMLLALKAWFVLNNPKQDIPKTHDLLKLFSRLSPSTQERLKSRYDVEILPHRSSFFVLRMDWNAFLNMREMHLLSGAIFMNLSVV